MGNQVCTITAAVLAVALAGGSSALGQAKKGQKKQGVERVVKRVKDAHAVAAGAQKEVASLNDAALDLTALYRNVQRRSASLKVYNDQLRELLKNQEIEVGKLAMQIDEVGQVGRQVLPLMQRMVDSLAKFVELDVPFLQEERAKRVRLLQELLKRADVTNAEKYRRVVEAYQVENDFGRTIEAYKERIKLGGTEKAVEFLRIGRVSLVYRSLDGKEYGAWDAKARAWQSLPTSYAREIMAGLRIAREQAAPNLLRIPVAAPEVAR